MITNTIKIIAFLPVLLSTYFLKAHRQANNKTSQHEHCRIFIHGDRLPVRFNSFNLIKDQETVLLNWQTVEEQSSKHYIVERGDNGRTYSAIATIPSNNGNDVSSYAFRDKAPLYGKSFYRLRQVDRNGGEMFSPVRAMQFLPHKQLHVVQSNHELALFYYSEEAKDYKLFNMQGTLMRQGAMRGSKCSITGLLPGSYILSLQTNTGTINATVTVTR